MTAALPVFPLEVIDPVIETEPLFVNLKLSDSTTNVFPLKVIMPPLMVTLLVSIANLLRTSPSLMTDASRLSWLNFSAARSWLFFVTLACKLSWLSCSVATSCRDANPDVFSTALEIVTPSFVSWKLLSVPDTYCKLTLRTCTWPVAPLSSRGWKYILVIVSLFTVNVKVTVFQSLTAAVFVLFAQVPPP